MNPKTITASLAALTAAVSVAVLATGYYPGAGKCRLCDVVIERADDAGQRYKAQTTAEVCGVEPKTDYEAEKQALGAARVVACGEAYSDKRLARDQEEKPVLAEEKGPTASGCACADQHKGASLCEWLAPPPPIGSKDEPKWGVAPTAQVLQAGSWRGDGCIPTVCAEATEVRETAGIGYATRVCEPE